MGSASKRVALAVIMIGHQNETLAAAWPTSWPSFSLNSHSLRLLGRPASQQASQQSRRACMSRLFAPVALARQPLIGADRLQAIAGL